MRKVSGRRCGCIFRAPPASPTIFRRTRPVANRGPWVKPFLVVEDDFDVRALTVALLRDLGYHVLQASDARSALDILDDTSRIDLLFTDVVLPGGMSGPQLAEEVQRRNRDISVLYMSGYTDNAIAHQGRLDRGVAILNKPFPKAALAQRVRSVLDKVRMDKAEV